MPAILAPTRRQVNATSQLTPNPNGRIRPSVAAHAAWGNCIAKTLVFPTNDGMGRRVFHLKLSLQLAYCLAKGVFPCQVKLKE